jgi:hypothetical protein
VVVEIVEAVHHSTWLGGAWAFVALGVYLLPMLGVVAPSSLVKNRRVVSGGVCQGLATLVQCGLPRVSVLGFRCCRVPLAVCSSF